MYIYVYILYDSGKLFGNSVKGIRADGRTRARGHEAHNSGVQGCGV